MLKKVAFLLLLFFSLLSPAQGNLFGLLKKKPQHEYVVLTVNKAKMYIMLYNQTPLHKANFLKLVTKKTYDGTLFHRVIPQFMIQGGAPDSKQAKKGTLLGESDLDYTVPAEFSDSLFHEKGALAAAREDNPEKASSASQFYLVAGKVYTDEELNRISENRFNGVEIPAFKREIYKTLGGTPFLDGNYTVFGQVVKGIALVDSISQLKADQHDRPYIDQQMQMTLLKTKEARALEKSLLEDPRAAAFILSNK